MNPQTMLLIVSYITASLVLLVGIIALSGFLLPATVPTNYRIIMGVVMILYGTYRIAMLCIKQQKAKRSDE